MPALLESRKASASLRASLAAGRARRLAEENRVRGATYRYTRRRWHVLMKLIDALGSCLFGLCRLIRRFLGVQTPPRTAPLSILLVQLDHLGDAVLTTAVLPALRREFPSAKIEVLASPASADVFSARSEIDRVWLCPRYRFARHGSWLWPLSVLAWGLRLRGRFDVAIDVRGELPLALLIWLAGAPRRLGWNAGGGGFLLTDSPPYVADRPEVDSRWALFGLLGLAPQGAAESIPRSRPTRQALADVSTRLRGVRVFGEPLYVLHLGSGMSAKRWPAAHWSKLVRQLIEQGPATMVLVGGQDEQPIARRIAAETPRAFDWTCQTTVPELTALAEFADVFVGADSGPAHLAASVGVATVVLFSGTNHAPQWQPRGRHVRVLKHEVSCSPCHRETCPLADHPCMTGLRVEDVLDAIDEVRTARPADMRCRIEA